MSTQQLAVINTQDMMSIAKAFAESGMFTDCKSVAQAVVKIQAGKEFGIQPFASMSGIHIIQGKPTIGAGLMAARVKGFGKYDYKLLQHDDTICSIEYFDKSKGTKESLGISTFTIADAKKAGTKNLDKFPKNMLFARAMSNGVKWYVPDIYETPVYVPEEMEHLQQTIETEVVEDYTNEINEAVSKLNASTTIDELKTLKNSLPSYVVNTEEFQNAGKIKFNELNQTTTHE
jgi:hypothetical protein